MNKKVLMIDDDLELGKLIDAILKPLGLTIFHAYTGEDGLKQAYLIHPDLVILDVMMPGMNGFDVCKRLRELSSVPILMLTARAQANDLLHGFNAGADDYLEKPFNKNEFEARVRALLKRSSNQNATEKASYITSYTDPVLEINLSSRSVKLKGKIVELSPKEYDLLAFLVREQGKTLSHRDLVQEAWGEPYINGPSESSLYIYYLRKKIKDGEHGHQYIRTLWGRGYWFEPRSGNETP